MRDGLEWFVPLGVRDRQHIERVIVVRVLISNEPKVPEGLIVSPTVDRKCGGIQPFLDRPRGVFRRGGLPCAHLQVKASTFDQLPFLGKSTHDSLEELDGINVGAALERFDPALV